MPPLSRRPPRRPGPSAARQLLQRRTRLFYLVIAIVFIAGTALVLGPQAQPAPGAEPGALPDLSFALYQDPSDPMHLFAGAAKGLLSSFNGGETWNAVSLPGGKATISAVARGPTAGRLYVAGPEIGVLRSDDAGATWRTVLPGAGDQRPAAGLPTAGHLITALALDPGDSDRLLAWSFQRGLLITQDGGESWSYAPGAPASSVAGLLISGQDPQRLLAATPLGLYESDDAGASWKPTASDVGPLSIAAIVESPVPPGSLYLATVGGAIWWSGDGGATWSQRGTTPDSSAVAALSPDRAMAEGLLLLTKDGRLLRSRDEGASWSLVAKLP